MKHAFIVLAHKDISHLSALIQCLRERADLYIHLDKKMDKMDKAYIFSFIGNGVFIFHGAMSDGEVFRLQKLNYNW